MRIPGRMAVFGAIVSVGVLLAVPPASAGVIFDMTGTCQSFCGSTGQSPGDPISGFVEFNDFDAAAAGSFLIPDSYHLEFGNVILDSTTPSSDYFLRSGNDTLQKIDASHIGAGTFDVWSATENIPIIFLGTCYGCSGDHWAYGFSPGSFGPFQFTRATPLPAPEPASTVPFVAGLAFLGTTFLRRRRVR